MGCVIPEGSRFVVLMNSLGFFEAWHGPPKGRLVPGGILKFYSDDAPGLKVGPTTVTFGRLETDRLVAGSIGGWVAPGSLTLDPFFQSKRDVTETEVVHSLPLHWEDGSPTLPNVTYCVP